MLGPNVALSATSGSVFTIPMQFGPIRRIPVCTAEAQERSLPLAPLVVDLAEAGRQHDQRPDTFPSALLRDLQHACRRDGDHRQVDRAGIASTVG